MKSVIFEKHLEGRDVRRKGSVRILIYRQPDRGEFTRFFGMKRYFPTTEEAFLHRHGML
jgi:hypothetical protein